MRVGNVYSMVDESGKVRPLYSFPTDEELRIAPKVSDTAYTELYAKPAPRRHRLRTNWRQVAWMIGIASIAVVSFAVSIAFIWLLIGGATMR